MTKKEGSHPDAGIFGHCVFRYFYLLLNTPEFQRESGLWRGTGCADVYGLGRTEPLPDSHTGL